MKALRLRRALARCRAVALFGVVGSLCCASAACTPVAAPRTVGAAEPERPRSAGLPRSAEQVRALDEAAVTQLRGGFRTRVGASGAAVVESVRAGESGALLHTLSLGEPPVAARWFGEAWSTRADRVRRVLADGVVEEVPAPAASPWRVRLTGPAGFPLGDFTGSWAHGSEGPSFTGRSAGGVVVPPVPGGGGGAWLPGATLRVEPVVGRWWIEDAAGREAWSRSSVPATVEPAPPEAGDSRFWSALWEGIDRRLAAGPLRVAANPWGPAFEAADAEDPEAAAARVLDAVLERK